MARARVGNSTKIGTITRSKLKMFKKMMETSRLKISRNSTKRVERGKKIKGMGRRSGDTIG